VPAASRKVDPEQQLADAIFGFAQDPLGYCRFNFPWGEAGTELANKRLRAWQVRFLDKVGKKLRAGAVDAGEVIRMARASGHGIGKSALVAMLIKWAFDTKIDTRGVVTANTDLQLRTKTWAELAKWHNLSLTKHWAKLTATALMSADPDHEKSWRIDAVPWSEHNTEAFAGLHNEGKRLLLVFDEASAIADKVWEVARGALTDKFTEIIWAVFGNATRATGYFRECFRKEKALWDTEQIDSREVEGVNLVELQKMVDTHGEDSDIVKVRIRGIFPAMSAKQFISETDADAAFGRHLREEQYSFAPVILTCDPSWSGEDPLVIGKRQGLKFEVLKVIPKNDNDIEVANLLARLEDEHRADAVFIDMGYGTGVYSAGVTMGRDWLLVSFGSAASDIGCLNKRAEMWRDMRDWLKAGGAIPPDHELRDELTGVETKPQLDGKIALESKDSMKKRGLPSPNKADALALSFAYPVQKLLRAAGGEVMEAHHETATSYSSEKRWL
jgi:hypothetical protein